MRKHLLLAAVLLIGACASSDQGSGIPVEVHAEPVGLASDILFFPGPLSVQFAVTVSNESNESITFRSVQLRTVGPGAFVLNSGSLSINKTIPPGSTGEFRVIAPGRSLGGDIRSREPVSLRGNAIFSSKSHKSFVRVFNEVLNP